MVKASDILAIEREELGYHEKKSNSNLYDKTANSGTKDYTKYAKELSELTGGRLASRGAWCCRFQCWSMYQACGKDMKKTEKMLCGPVTKSSSQLASQFKAKGQWFKRGEKTPKPGDFIFTNIGGKIGHIGMVEKVKNNRVYTIEGNVSYKVKRKNYSLKSLYINSYARPKYESEVIEKESTVLKGIDVSSWDITSHKAHTDSVYKSGVDFVIVKATEGVSYVNPYYKEQYNKAKKDNKLLGAYHYAKGLDAKKEAKYFYDAVKNIVGEATFWLDWESGGNKSWGNVNWCKTFCEEFYRLSGVYPGVYIQASAVGQAANIADKAALWIAGYPKSIDSWSAPAFPYKVFPWKEYTIWQFTSKNGTDRNIGGKSLTAEKWKELAAVKKTTQIEKPAASSSSYYAKVTAKSGLNIRPTASTSKKPIGLYKYGTKIQIVKISTDKK